MPTKAALRRLYGLALLGTALAFAGCAGDRATDLTAPQANAVIVPHLPISDPCPQCEGVFLTGSASSWGNCALAPGIDYDVDGVDDSCERSVAQAFAPQLYMSQSDQAPRMEPYWAVKKLSEFGDNQVLGIIYMFAYNDDAGSPDPAILNDPLVPDWMKTAHHGDSEWIYMTVHFDTSGIARTGGTNGRWVLNYAQYSNHSGPISYAAAQLTYPGPARRYPIDWISKNKHANYNSQASCEAGGWQGLDTCADNTVSLRLPVLWGNNVGSTNAHLINCVTSTDPSRYHGEECLWTDSAFRGWYLDSETNGEQPYIDQLYRFVGSGGY